MTCLVGEAICPSVSAGGELARQRWSRECCRPQLYYTDHQTSGVVDGQSNVAGVLDPEGDPLRV